MSAENLKSPSITNLDSQPIIVPTTGEGTAGFYQKQVNDFVTPTTAGLATTTNTYRCARIPSTAKIKQVLIAVPGATPLGTTGPSFDVNLIFSDSAFDGTQAALQNLIPTSANNGTTTTIAAYASPNKLFGTVSLANITGSTGWKQDVTFNGSYTAANMVDDIWDVFGFVNAQGAAQDPGGNFDVLLYLSTAATVAAAGTAIAVEVDFSV